MNSIIKLNRLSKVKKITIITLFIFFNHHLYSQITTYDIKSENSNYYDKEMETYNGWKGWKEIYEKKDIKLAVSQNVIKIDENFTSVYSESYKTYKCKFIQDSPTSEFPFRKKVEVFESYNVYTNGIKKMSVEQKGYGYTYGAFTMEQLISGNAEGAIYLYYEFENGEKAYLGFLLSN